MKRFFITGIGTDVGKTLVSAILTEALKADYWKPVQSGATDGRDLEKVRELISNSKSKFHEEAYLLKEPLSPHLAAKKENIRIESDKIEFPFTDNDLIIEGAGGPLVPLNEHEFVIDLAKKFNAEIILVISNYLGCINHSLLCIDFLTQQNFEIRGLVLNGNFDPEVEKAIIDYKPLQVLARIPFFKDPDKQFVKRQALIIETDLFA
jgi:dethiobiotin synthetase